MSTHAEAPSTLTIAARIERLATFGHRRAYLWRDGVRWRTRTYAELLTGVRGAAATLRAAGLKPKEPVLVQGPDEPDWIEALLGVFLAGGVAVPLEAATADAFRDRIASTVGARLIFAPAAIPPPPGARRIDFGSWRDGAAAPAASGAVAGAASGTPAPPASLQDTAEIVFTSGTTGEPKGVVLTHENLAADFAPLEEGYRKHERFVRPL